MSDPRNKVTGANEFIKEKQAFLDFINQDPIPTAEEVVKFTRNMPPRLVAEIKFIMTSGLIGSESKDHRRTSRQAD